MALVFISCGQYTEQEKSLGKTVAAIVKGFGFEPYFAETQSSLNGLHENILNKLNECAGLISIMHERGKVVGADGKSHCRGSVWIEQEIAIAAFITHSLKRKLEVACFISKKIKREGIRDLLHLNPTMFAADNEILEKLPAVLGTWKLGSPTRVDVDVEVAYRKTGGNGTEHRYALDVNVSNLGPARIEKYQLDLSFPNAFLNQGSTWPSEVRDRRTATHRLFRATERLFGNVPILPGDTKRLLVIDYVMNQDLAWDETALDQVVTATFRFDEEQPIAKQRVMRDLQNF